MHNLADQMGFTVEYRGVNGVGQHLFANGEPYVTDVYATLDEAIERFGGRIDTRKDGVFYSMMFKLGQKSAFDGKAYEPPMKDHQSLIEYGLGYISGRLERIAIKQVPVPPAPPKAPDPEPEASPAKKRKRRPKAQNSELLNID